MHGAGLAAALLLVTLLLVLVAALLATLAHCGLEEFAHLFDGLLVRLAVAVTASAAAAAGAFTLLLVLVAALLALVVVATLPVVGALVVALLTVAVALALLVALRFALRLLLLALLGTRLRIGGQLGLLGALASGAGGARSSALGLDRGDQVGLAHGRDALDAQPGRHLLEFDQLHAGQINGFAQRDSFQRTECAGRLFSAPPASDMGGPSQRLNNCGSLAAAAPAV